MGMLFDYAEFTARLQTAAEVIAAEKDRLSKLDSALGDGDHGAAMGRVCETIRGVLAADGKRALKPMLSDLAWEVMSAAGGSTSTLYGSLFLGLSDGLDGSGSVDSNGLATMFEAAVTEVKRNTQAEPGGKTLMDALVPAVRALRGAADRGLGCDAALEAAAMAAEQGAEATRQMRAVHGRARNLGDRTIGHVDPGAASMALLFRGLAG